MYLPLSTTSPTKPTLEDRFEVGELKSITRLDNCWRVEAVFQARSDRCPICQRSMLIHEWSRGRSPYFDMPYEGLPVQIFVTRPRYRCRNCDITRTPVVPGLEEGHRITRRLIEFLPSSIWYSTSLRTLAKSAGMSPASLGNVLKSIAQEAQSDVLMPSKIGIHEFRVGERTHIVVSNLDLGSVVAFFPAGASQLTLLAMFLEGVEGKTEIQEITSPANINILTAIFDGSTNSNCYCSLTSIHDLLPEVISKATNLRSKKGLSGSISPRKAFEIAQLHLLELSPEQHSGYLRGLQIKDPFWASFAAKEDLIEAIQKNASIAWFETVGDWYRNLPATQQVTFGPVVTKIYEMREFSPVISTNQMLGRIETELRTLERLLVRPGVRFSDEMISTLLLASPLMHVPIKREIGSKGAGPYWLEEHLPAKIIMGATHAGTHLESLVGLLTVIWANNS